MRNDRSFLHLVRMNASNLMNDKRPRFHLVLYVWSRTYFPHKHMFHPYSYNPTYEEIFAPTCQLQQNILYEMKLSQSTPPQKNALCAHNKILHTNMIQCTKTFLLHTVNCARNYFMKKTITTYTGMLHMSSFSSTYNNISTSD